MIFMMKKDVHVESLGTHNPLFTYSLLTKKDTEEEGGKRGKQKLKKKKEGGGGEGKSMKEKEKREKIKTRKKKAKKKKEEEKGEKV